MVSGPTNGWYYVKLANGTYGYASASYVTTGTVATNSGAPTSLAASSNTTASVPTSISYSNIVSTMSLSGSGVSPLEKALRLPAINTAVTAATVALTTFHCPLSLDMLLVSLALTNSTPPALSNTISNLLVNELCSSPTFIGALSNILNAYKANNAFPITVFILPSLSTN